MQTAFASLGALPWSRREADEARYTRIQTATLGPLMLLAAIVPHLPVFLEQIKPVEETPPVVKLTLIPRPPPPPPRPQGGGETVRPQPAPTRASADKPRQAERPAPQARPSAEAARERAARAGVLSASRELAELRNSAVLTRIQSDRPLIGATSSRPTANPEVLVAGAEQGSGGISTAGVGQSNSSGGTTLREGGTGGGTGRGVGGTGGRGTGGTGGGSGGGSGGQGAYQPKRSSESIQLVFDRNKSGFESLYQRALRQNPALQGAVVFELTIQPDGRVSACRVVSSELRDPELESKLVSRIQLLNFGAEEVPTITVVNPLRFYPR